MKTEENSPKSTFFRPQIMWPALVVMLLLIPVLADAFLIYKVQSDPSFSVEEDYYQKALNWDAKMAQDRANATLGWEASAVTMAQDNGKRLLRLGLTDSTGAPVEAASIEVVVFHNARYKRRQTVTLSAVGDGVYQASLNMAKPGIWELRVKAVQGDVRFTDTLRMEVESR